MRNGNVRINISIRRIFFPRIRNFDTGMLDTAATRDAFARLNLGLTASASARELLPSDALIENMGFSLSTTGAYHPMSYPAEY